MQCTMTACVRGKDHTNLTLDCSNIDMFLTGGGVSFRKRRKGYDTRMIRVVLFTYVKLPETCSAPFMIQREIRTAKPWKQPVLLEERQQRSSTSTAIQQEQQYHIVSYCCTYHAYHTAVS